MAYQVTIASFEGPLDLLLQLVERSSVNVTSITLADITDQYLNYIQTLPSLEPEELGQFLELATRLLHIKSLALLPELTAPEIEERDALLDQLQAYQRYQQAAGTLAALLRGPQRAFVRPATVALAPEDLPLPRLALGDLQAVFSGILRRQPEPAAELELEPTVSIEERIEQIASRLDNGAVSLSELVAENPARSAVIVTFLAILELYRQRSVAIEQTSDFEDLVIDRV